MDKSTKIFIAGHRGLVGSALCRVTQARGYNNLLIRRHHQLDLTERDAVMRFFAQERPQWVFLAAAKVGGIYANNAYPVDFLLDNLKIQNNVIEAAHAYGVEKLLFLGSSCIYPKLAPQPIKEEYLLSSGLEPTNEPYAIAKIAGIKLCSAYNRQYGANFMSVMPTNLYGPNDNYHAENAHVIPMLLRRFYQAREAGDARTVLWGTGTPRREFLYSDDLAEACLFLMENYNAADLGEFINIGTGEDCSILELAQLIKEVVGYPGELVTDPSKPDGTPRKLLDVSRLHALGWRARTGLRQGLALALEDFLRNPGKRL